MVRNTSGGTRGTASLRVSRELRVASRLWLGGSLALAFCNSQVQDLRCAECSVRDGLMGWPVWHSGHPLCPGRLPAEGGWATYGSANSSEQA